MNQPERNFWKLVKDHLPGDVSRIENIADVGTPDITGACYVGDYWVELKVCGNKEKARPVEKLLRPAQNVWHARRAKQGSIIFTLVKYEKKILCYLAPETTPVLILEKIKNKWDWEVLTNFIIEKL